jgi:hypothetical protein
MTGAVLVDPGAAARRACGYPPPLVDHAEAVAAYRQRLRYA